MSDEDRISKVFKDKTVFISGASGFLGKLLVEKLLRCTEVKKIFLLIREKKGKTATERMKDIFGNSCFTLLKQQKADAFKKCVVIPGDVMDLNLGISQENRKILEEEVEFIFHSAASTRFDDTIQFAVQMNTIGTRYMLDLAKNCLNLQIFVHVSTAYAFPNEKILYERFYDPPANPDEVIQSINWIKGQETPAVTKGLLAGSPNTYTFSKALAEELVRREIGNLPVIVVRPALVIPCLDEPIPGWVNNFQGPVGIFVGGGKGVIRTMYMDCKTYINMIPADSVINCVMVSTWNYLTTKKNRVFNVCVPDSDIKMTWEEIIELGKVVINQDVPFNQMLWYPDGVMTKCKTWHYLNFFLFQIIPAIVVDFLLMCLGYKRFLLAINIRLYKGQQMFEYYTNKTWDFNVDNLKKLRRVLNDSEKKKYKIEADGIDIRKYVVGCMLYARRYVFHETDDRLPAAKRLVKVLFVLDRIVKILFYVVIAKYFYKWILQPIFG